MAKKSYDALLKLLLIGDSSVGKTCLIMKYVDDEFNTSFISTIGIDFKIKTISLGEHTVKLQIWDTAGQERFRTITASYYRGAMGILLVYSISQRISFENISNWIKAISENASTDVETIIVANKADMTEERAVSTQEGEEIAKKYGAQFIETSAKTGLNVDEAFRNLSLAIKRKQPNLFNHDQTPSNTAYLNPSHKSGNPPSAGCGC